MNFPQNYLSSVLSPETFKPAKPTTDYSFMRTMYRVGSHSIVIPMASPVVALDLDTRKPNCSTPFMDSESDTATTPSVCAPASETEQERSGSTTHQELTPMHPEEAIDSPTASEPSAPAPTPEADPEEPAPATEQQRPPNYWEQIMNRHARALYSLPVPPKDFAMREAGNIPTRQHKRQRWQRCEKTSLEALLRGNIQKTRRLDKSKNISVGWVLMPTTERQPERMPGVPAITVTTPEGDTCWPKDTNSYISAEMVAWLTKRQKKLHKGPVSEEHWAAFQEAHRRGLGREPHADLPAVLYCNRCWAKQQRIEEEEARVELERAHAEEEERTRVDPACSQNRGGEAQEGEAQEGEEQEGEEQEGEAQEGEA